MKPTQNPTELREFVDLLKAEGITSFLEVGSKFGTTFGAIGAILPPGGRAVSVDLPAGTKAWTVSKENLQAVVNGMKRGGIDARIIWGDSTDRNVIAQVQALAPFDAVFIDANHTMPYVTQDWLNYGPMGKIVAFHDISWWRDPANGPIVHPIDVPAFWASLRQNHKHVEITHEQHNNGIGVLWRD